MTVLREEHILYSVLIVFLTVASYTDIKYSKIYNIWVLIASLPVIYIRSYSFFIWAAVSTACGFILYICRMVGAGDIKLVAYIYATLGPGHASTVLLISLSIAAVYALYFLLSKKILYIRLLYLKEYVSKCIKNKNIYEYYDINKNDRSLTMPMAQWLLAGFIIWRIYYLCMII
jgi:hypothetical protein